MKFCPRRMLSTIASINSGFYSHLVLCTWEYVNKGLFLFEIMSTWHSVYLDACLLEFCPLGIWSLWQSVHIGRHPRKGLSNLVWFTFCSIYLWGGPTGCLSTWFFLLWSLARWHPPHAGLCPLLVSSTLDFAHVWFCLLGILSNLVFVYLDSVHLGVLPHDILPRQDCVHYWVCQL